MNMHTHKELKNFIKTNKLISTMDHLIACDKHGWTDLRFTQLDTKLTPESKYFLAINIDNVPHILYYANLLDLRHEIDEKMIKSSFIKGYDPKNNRVHLHYEKDGIFRIGNKRGIDTFYVQFENCSLKELAKRHNYSKYLALLGSKEKHIGIQTLLCELGVSLGFTVKIARNDKSKIFNQNPLFVTSKMFLNFSDLDLQNIIKKPAKEDIDLIDVLLCDPNNQRIVAAFEVELSRNYAQLFQRFSSLIQTTNYPIHLIAVGDDFYNFKANFNRPLWQYTFANSQLKYLCLDRLSEVLTLNKECSDLDASIVFKKLINDKMLPVTSFI